MAGDRPEAIDLHPVGAATSWRAAKARLCCSARNGAQRQGKKVATAVAGIRSRWRAAPSVFGQTCPIEDERSELETESGIRPRPRVPRETAVQRIG